MNLKYFDISPLISAKTGVFPGDVSFTQEASLSFEKGHHLMLSSIRSTVHIGAHADGPNHYTPNGKSIDQVSLEPYLGPCLLLTAKTPVGERVLPEDLNLPNQIPPRILIRTNSFPNPDKWNSNFSSLSPELIQLLHQRGVRLVGLDTPSVDPEKDQEMRSHKALAATDMRVLEGLVFDQVQDGGYFLIALPLKLSGLDASPVRAVLLQENIS